MVPARHVLVTGATGFVGTSVALALADAGVRMRALVRPTSRTEALERAGAEIVRGQLNDAATLAHAVSGVDVVIHLAARIHARTEAEYRGANAEATRNLVRALLEAGSGPSRIVYLSSLAAVGPSREGRPVRPEDPARPLTAYGRSKLDGETACLEARDRMEVVILRAPAVYGPRDAEMFRFFRFAEAGWIPVPGGGSQPIQLVHVTDLARAILLAATRPGVAGTFHVAEAAVRDMKTVARLVAEAVGRSARILPLPGPIVSAAALIAETANRALGRSSLLNRDKVRELLAPGWLCETEGAARAFGFEAEIPLPEGLRATADWYRRNGWLRA